MLLERSTPSVEQYRGAALVHALREHELQLALKTDEWSAGAKGFYTLLNREVPRNSPVDLDTLRGVYCGVQVAVLRDPLIGGFELLLPCEHAQLQAVHAVCNRLSLRYGELDRPQMVGEVLAGWMFRLFESEPVFCISFMGVSRRPGEPGYHGILEVLAVAEEILKGRLYGAAARTLGRIIAEADEAFR